MKAFNFTKVLNIYEIFKLLRKISLMCSYTSKKKLQKEHYSLNAINCVIIKKRYIKIYDEIILAIFCFVTFTQT